MSKSVNYQMSLFEAVDPPKESTDWKWSFKDYPKEKNGLKVFSCFACGGGSTMGYKLAGCDVLGCVEIDPKMNEIYVKNHHPKYNFLMDIRDFNSLPDADIPNELFNLDILDGSPPCTTFSVAGLREETWGKKKRFREGQKEQTLDDLSFVFIETIKKLKPKVVIMENVEGLLIGQAWGYVQQIYKGFLESGYSVSHWLLKAEQMGVPQTRHRVFFVGIRSDLMIDPIRLNMSFNYKNVTFGEIKSGIGKKLSIDSKMYEMLSRALPCDKRISDTFIRLGEKESWFGCKIAWDNNVMQTILAAGGDNFRGKERTYVSVEDLIHAQTFPEDYDFIERTYSAVKYICGMSVPPLMIKRVVDRLVSCGVFSYKGVTKENV